MRKEGTFLSRKFVRDLQYKNSGSACGCRRRLKSLLINRQCIWCSEFALFPHFMQWFDKHTIIENVKHDGVRKKRIRATYISLEFPFKSLNFIFCGWPHDPRGPRGFFFLFFFLTSTVICPADRSLISSPSPWKPRGWHSAPCRLWLTQKGIVREMKNLQHQSFCWRSQEVVCHPVREHRWSSWAPWLSRLKFQTGGSEGLMHKRAQTWAPKRAPLVLWSWSASVDLKVQCVTFTGICWHEME